MKALLLLVCAVYVGKDCEAIRFGERSMSAVALSDVVVSLQEVADVYRITCCVPPMVKMK